MDTKIILVYCLCDDYLKSINHREDRQVRLSDAEVMTIALVAALEFGGNFAQSLRFLSSHGYLSYRISRSRYSRRLHRIRDHFLVLFLHLGEVWKALDEEGVYLLDTFPIAVCDNIRISRCRIYQDEAFRGYQASKKRFFYGLKLHLMVTRDGAPVEFFLTPGSTGDVTGLEHFDFDLPFDSLIIGDKAYNNYEIEDLLAQVGLDLEPVRKKNSTRPAEPALRFLQSFYRKAVETAGSMIERLLPKSIHATSQAGFELKVVLFVLASSINHIPLP